MNTLFTHLLGLTATVALGHIAQGQPEPLSLAECHHLAEKNYPLAKQRDLIAQSARFSVEKAHTSYFPQLNITGQATYQSAVTEIPIQVPGMAMPALSKDQYKLYGEVNQTLYDGGITRLQKAAATAGAEMEKRALEVELYGVKQRVNQLFFGILLLDAQLVQNRLFQQDIVAGLEKTQAAIANGSSLISSASLLEAELLKTQQQESELQASRKAYMGMLGLFINRPLDEHTVLQRPAVVRPSLKVNRPEIQWYTSQLRVVDVEDQLLTAKNLPKLSLFLQGGIGRPALNMLSNDLEAYYYGGVQITIPISGFYTIQKDRALLDIRRRAIDLKQETFLFNTDLSLRQQRIALDKYEELLATDDRIIALRTSVKAAALAQLENGVINAADYLREVHAEDLAKVTKILHEVQRLLIQYDIQQLSGK
ncbi:TolC family protein [Parapedobacter deserti]|uniref:TolC family protein n=1 Tax=Parapedobacter deserti TaxID=1912957 RepID=A0ABV7JQA6_9SPHI